MVHRRELYMRPYREAHSSQVQTMPSCRWICRKRHQSLRYWKLFRQNWRIQAIPDILFIRQLWEMFPSRSAQKIKHRFRKKQLISGLKIHPWIQRMQWDLSMTVQMAHLHCMILKKIHFNSKRMCNWKPRQL